MKTKPDIVAGGAVVIRKNGKNTQILLVHRPKYGDWGLPKGKVKTDEQIPVAAVREVAEETGVKTILRRSLGQTNYRVSGKNKTVYWWLASETGSIPWKPNGEIDQVAWVDAKQARQRLSYTDEKEILDRALKIEAGKTLLIVRHAKAMDRKHWNREKDHDRRLTERGRRQAKAMVALLESYGVTKLYSSSSTRCVDTVKPAAKKLKLELVKIAELSEEKAKKHPEQVGQVMAKIAQKSLAANRVVAVCGHRPVFPLMFDGLNLAPRTLKPGEVVVIYYNLNDEIIDIEAIRPRL